MPSEKILAEKKQIVADMAAKLKSSCAGVLVDYKGINVADDTKLRRELRENGVDYEVVKNRLLALAADQADLPEMKSVLEGTTALALHPDDHVAAARILCAFADKHKDFSIKLGFLEGNIISDAGVKNLASLPSREVLVAKVLGGFNAPISGLVGVLNANLRGLAVALNAIAEQKGA